jgi:F-type H+/Na+-transporting ATPase subunit beta
MAAEVMYPAVDPLSSSSILLDPAIVGEKHYRIAEQVREAIAHYKELQDIISLLGIEELSARDRLIVARARRLQRFLTQPFAVTEAFTGKPGRSVPLAETLKGCQAILDGACDALAAIARSRKSSPRGSSSSQDYHRPASSSEECTTWRRF